MRWMLAIDTCGAAGGVALVEMVARSPGYQVVAERGLPGRETQERLMLAVGEVLAAAAIAVGDLHVLGVVTGPGSFTGVRIGLAAVKGLTEALGLPVVAVSRLAVLAASVPSVATHRLAVDGEHGFAPADLTDRVAMTGAHGLVEAWIDAGRGDVFAGRYRADVAVDEAMLTCADAIARHDAGQALVVMEEVLAARMPEAVLVPAVGVGEAVPLLVGRVLAGAFEDIALLDAHYLRVPDAELARLRAAAAA